VTESDLVRKIKLYVKAFGDPPEVINNGACGLFAQLVIDSLGGETEELYASFTERCTNAHEWITYNGRHYDAECPFGVDDETDLPFEKRYKVWESQAGSTQGTASLDIKDRRPSRSMRELHWLLLEGWSQENLLRGSVTFD
jgi:hypothetical protein